MLSDVRSHRYFALSKQLYGRMKSLFPDDRTHRIATSVLSIEHIFVSERQQTSTRSTSQLNKTSWHEDQLCIVVDRSE
jgi:hypothetical protein